MTMTTRALVRTGKSIGPLILGLSLLVPLAWSHHETGDEATWGLGGRLLHAGGSVRQLVVGASRYCKPTSQVYWLEHSGAILSADPLAGRTSVVRVDDGLPSDAIAATGKGLYRLRGPQVEHLDAPGKWSRVDLGPAAMSPPASLWGRPTWDDDPGKIYLQLADGSFGALGGKGFDRIVGLPRIVSLAGGYGCAALALEDGRVAFALDAGKRGVGRVKFVPVETPAIKVFGKPDEFFYLDACARVWRVRRRGPAVTVFRVDTRGVVVDLLDSHRDGLHLHLLKDDGSLWWKIAERRQDGVPDEYRRSPTHELTLAVALDDPMISRFVGADDDGRVFYYARAADLRSENRPADRVVRFQQLYRQR